MPNDPLSKMLPNSGYPLEGEEPEVPEEEGGGDLEIAFSDFDNPEMPPEVRAGALKLILELIA